MRRERATMLRKAGCRLLRFGVESGSDRILAHMRKGTTVSEIEECLRASAEAGLWNHVNLIAGYPAELPSDVRATTEFMKRNSTHIHSIKVSPFYVNAHLLARWGTPDEHGTSVAVEKTSLDSIYYRLSDGRTWEEIRESTLDCIQEIDEAARVCGIGFAGCVVDILFPALARFGERECADRFLRTSHPYLYRNYPPAVMLDTLYFGISPPDLPPRQTWAPWIGRWGGSSDYLSLIL